MRRCIGNRRSEEPMLRYGPAKNRLPRPPSYSADMCYIIFLPQAATCPSAPFGLDGCFLLFFLLRVDIPALCPSNCLKTLLAGLGSYFLCVPLILWLFVFFFAVSVTHATPAI